MIFSISEMTQFLNVFTPKYRQNEFCKKLLKYDILGFIRSVPTAKRLFWKKYLLLFSTAVQAKSGFLETQIHSKTDIPIRAGRKKCQNLCVLLSFFYG